MPDLTIYGSSDDLVEVEGVLEQEHNAEDVTLLVSAGGDRRAVVRAVFDPQDVGTGEQCGGCWAITVAPFDEDVPGFAGRIEITGYTARLTLDVPDDVSVERIGGGEED